MAVLDPGPFFHGTKADLKIGDFLTAGFRSNYRETVVMNHIYFTAMPKGAGLAAERESSAHLAIHSSRHRFAARLDSDVRHEEA